MTSVRWERVDALVDASPGVEDLRAHGLHLLAARRWRATGRAVPDWLVREEVGAAWRTHAAPRVLEAVRAACAGEILVIKGSAVARLFPDPAARPFVDIDLLVPDHHSVQDALLRAGFRPSADPAGFPAHLHHLPPVHSPAHPIPIEVHRTLKWPAVLQPPSFGAIAARAEDGVLGVAGIATPAPEEHALLLAGHLWGHDPLTRLLRLLDIAVIGERADPERLRRTADAWGMGRLWRCTATVADALFGEASARPWPLRTWARALSEAREPTVAELHAGRLMSPFAAYPPAAATRAVGAALAGFVRPHDGEPWRRKLERTARQVASPSMRRSEHVARIEGRRRGEDGAP